VVTQETKADGPSITTRKRLCTSAHHVVAAVGSPTQPDRWEITEPDWSMVQHNTEANVWQAKQQTLMDHEVTKILCRGWTNYRPNTHILLKSGTQLRKEEMEIRMDADDSSCDLYEHPFKEATTDRLSVASNPSKEIALKWEDNKENYEDDLTHNAESDKDLKKSILKKKARDETIKNEVPKKYGTSNRNRLGVK
jgi:hypothetical protein